MVLFSQAICETILKENGIMRKFMKIMALAACFTVFAATAFASTQDYVYNTWAVKGFQNTTGWYHSVFEGTFDIDLGLVNANKTSYNGTISSTDTGWSNGTFTHQDILQYRGETFFNADRDFSFVNGLTPDLDVIVNATPNATVQNATFHGFSAADKCFAYLASNNTLGTWNGTNSSMFVMVNNGTLQISDMVTAVQGGDTWYFYGLYGNNSGDFGLITTRVGNFTYANSALSVGVVDPNAGTAVKNATLTSGNSGIDIFNGTNYASDIIVFRNATVDCNSEVIAGVDFNATSNIGTLTVAIKGDQFTSTDVYGKVWSFLAFNGSSAASTLGKITVGDAGNIDSGKISLVSTGATPAGVTVPNGNVRVAAFDAAPGGPQTVITVQDAAGVLLVNATGRMVKTANKNLFVGVVTNGGGGLEETLVIMTAPSSSSPVAGFNVTETNTLAPTGVTVSGFAANATPNPTAAQQTAWGWTDFQPITSELFAFNASVNASSAFMVWVNATVDQGTGLTIGDNVILWKVNNTGATVNSVGVAGRAFTYDASLDDVTAAAVANKIGRWCLYDHDLADCLASGQELADNRVYQIRFVTQDGTWDLDATSGLLVDPVTLLRTDPTGASDGDGSSGCVLNPAAGFGLEWLLILLAPFVAVFRNRF